MNETYLADFNVWIDRTAQLLRERRWHEIDLENLIEEVENLGKSERRGVASQLTRLLLHLLKWQYQPQRRSDSWLDSISQPRGYSYHKRAQRCFGRRGIADRDYTTHSSCCCWTYFLSCESGTPPQEATK